MFQSRCRSVVYDTVQHICHYFSDEGVDQAILSAKMTYLRVVSQSCLRESFLIYFGHISSFVSFSGEEVFCSEITGKRGNRDIL